MIITDEELARIWANYFDKLLSCEQSIEVFPLIQNIRKNHLCLSPPLEEISHHIKKLNNYKSSRKDEIVAELLNNNGKELTQRIWKIMTKVWKQEEIPEDWITAICPIHKQGNRKNCNNYRGIALLNIAYKIFANCIRSRI